MINKIWIRVDRQDGSISEVSEQYVIDRCKTIYYDIDLAVRDASEEMPLTNGFANYYPKN